MWWGHRQLPLKSWVVLHWAKSITGNKSFHFAAKALLKWNRFYDLKQVWFVCSSGEKLTNIFDTWTSKKYLHVLWELFSRHWCLMLCFFNSALLCFFIQLQSLTNLSVNKSRTPLLRTYYSPAKMWQDNQNVFMWWWTDKYRSSVRWWVEFVCNIMILIGWRTFWLHAEISGLYILWSLTEQQHKHPASSPDSVYRAHLPG